MDTAAFLGGNGAAYGPRAATPARTLAVSSGTRYVADAGGVLNSTTTATPIVAVLLDAYGQVVATDTPATVAVSADGLDVSSQLATMAKGTTGDGLFDLSLVGAANGLVRIMLEIDAGAMENVHNIDSTVSPIEYIHNMWRIAPEISARYEPNAQQFDPTEYKDRAFVAYPGTPEQSVDSFIAYRRTDAGRTVVLNTLLRPIGYPNTRRLP